MEPPRVVLDTNILISSAINPRGLPRRIVERWRQGQLALLTSAEIVTEVERVLNKPRIAHRFSLSTADIRDVVDGLREGAELVSPLSPLPLRSRDPDDDMFVAVALGGAADYLVTGDDDLLSLKGAPEIGTLQIVTAREFIDLLSGTGAEPSGENTDNPSSAE